MDPIIKKGIVLSLPIFAGYLFLGSTFGIMLVESGYPFWLAPIMSLFIYAGSGQIAAVGLMVLDFDLINAFIITVIINARHIFYGISMLEKFSGTGKLKPYMIFSLTDETFAILLSQANNPKTKKKLMFTVCLLNHIYWIIGGTVGAVLYSILRFDTQGIEFVLTALFIVILTEQLITCKNKLLAPIGIITTILCLIIFKENFMIISLILILIILSILRKPFEEIEGGI